MTPAVRGKTRFPEPKNIENMAKPAVRTIRKDDIVKVLPLFLEYIYMEIFDKNYKENILYCLFIGVFLSLIILVFLAQS